MKTAVRLLCVALAALAFGCQPITWDAPHGDAGATATPHKLGAGPPLYGPTTVALAQAVALASDHAPIAVTGAVTPGTLGQATMANSAPVVIASNQSSVAMLEQNQPVYEDNAAGVAVVEQRYTGSTPMTTATTTTIKSGAGFLHVVNVGTCVSGATISLFDNTAGSGASMAVITCPANTAAMPTFIFDRTFATGLTAVTSGATNVSFSYRFHGEAANDNGLSWLREVDAEDRGGWAHVAGWR